MEKTMMLNAAERAQRALMAVRMGRCEAVTLQTIEAAALTACVSDFLPHELACAIETVENEVELRRTASRGSACMH